MHKIEAISTAESREHLRIFRGHHRVPPHVWQHRRVQTLHHARPFPTALRINAVLHAMLKQHLHAHANPHDGPTTSQTLPNQARTIHSTQPIHTRRKRAYAGNKQAIGGENRLRITGHRDLSPHALHRALRRTKVARAVIKKRHCFSHSAKSSACVTTPRHSPLAVGLGLDSGRGGCRPMQGFHSLFSHSNCVIL